MIQKPIKGNFLSDDFQYIAFGLDPCKGTTKESPYQACFSPEVRNEFFKSVGMAVNFIYLDTFTD